MYSGGGAVKEWNMFGTTMLALVGTLNVSQGLLVGFASGGIGFDRGEVAFTSATTWAAATVTLGVLLAVTGVALRARKGSARAAAVGVVALHAISQLAMLRAYPAWSLLMVTLDVIILFILTAPRGGTDGAGDVDGAPEEIPVASVTKLALRRNSRSDAYRARHKAGRPIVRHEHDVILVDIVQELAPAGTDLDVVDLDSPSSWVRAVGYATVPMVLADPDSGQVGEPVEESLVPVQRASLDPLMDPLPVLIAATADTAIIEGVMVEDHDDGELAAIGARPYVHR